MPLSVLNSPFAGMLSPGFVRQVEEWSWKYTRPRPKRIGNEASSGKNESEWYEARWPSFDGGTRGGPGGCLAYVSHLCREPRAAPGSYLGSKYVPHLLLEPTVCAQPFATSCRVLVSWHSI